MTKAGEKLYGDWQRALRDDCRRRPLLKLLVRLVLCVALAILLTGILLAVI
jgi:hypothetical protein